MKYDIFQNQVLAYFSNQEGRHDIAVKLMVDSYFSPLYLESGIRMLKQNADEGYAPSQVSYGDYIILSRPHDDSKMAAMTYYQMAAAQDYEPARIKLVALNGD